MAISTIIFDYDGVIADSFPSVFGVYQKICKHFKVACPADIEKFRSIYGYNYFECQRNLGILEKDFAEVNLIFGEEIVKAAYGVFDGITEVIQELAGEYQLYLLSASHSKEVLPRLERAGLKSFFAKIYCGADEKIHKGKLFKILLKENNINPEEILSIGDRAIDYDTGKNIGLADKQLIMVDYGWGLDKTKIGKAKIAKNPREIAAIVRDLTWERMTK